MPTTTPRSNTLRRRAFHTPATGRPDIPATLPVGEIALDAKTRARLVALRQRIDAHIDVLRVLQVALAAAQGRSTDLAAAMGRLWRAQIPR